MAIISSHKTHVLHVDTMREIRVMLTAARVAWMNQILSRNVHYIQILHAMLEIVCTMLVMILGRKFIADVQHLPNWKP